MHGAQQHQQVTQLRTANNVAMCTPGCLTLVLLSLLATVLAARPTLQPTQLCCSLMIASWAWTCPLVVT
jgi:hypothetical protein